MQIVLCYLYCLDWGRIAGVYKLPPVLDLHTTKQGEEDTRPCSESEMGRYNSASEGHRFSTRMARRIAEKAARQLEQQSEKQAAHAEKKAQAKKAVQAEKAARKLVQQSEKQVGV